MQPNRQTKRKGRQLLIAAVGIASVSYVGTMQGCADVDPPADQSGESQEEAEASSSELGQSQNALTVGTAVTTTPIIKRLPPVGNLMPGPIGPEIITTPVIKVPIPVGNLMVTPVDVTGVTVTPALNNVAVSE